MKPVAEQLKTSQYEYMHWAKTRSDAKFNLATSGLANLSLTDLEFNVNELELTGLDSYGYKPLIHELSRRYRVDPKSSVVIGCPGTLVKPFSLFLFLSTNRHAAVAPKKMKSTDTT